MAVPPTVAPLCKTGVAENFTWAAAGVAMTPRTAAASMPGCFMTGAPKTRPPAAHGHSGSSEQPKHARGSRSVLAWHRPLHEARRLRDREEQPREDDVQVALLKRSQIEL